MKYFFLHILLTALTITVLSSQLEELRLGGNKLTHFPSELTQLPNLIALDLSGNRLTNLPIGINNLISLKYLMLNRNQFTVFPLQLTQLKLN